MTLNNYVLSPKEQMLAQATPTMATSATDPTLITDTRNSGQKLIDILKTGGYSAANSVLMGLPDFLVDKIGGSENLKKLQDMRAQNQGADTYGQVLGTAGSMFIPGGTGLKLAGKAAEGLGAVNTAEKLAQAANYLKGGTELTGNLAQKIGKGTLQGTAQAAEQTLPRVMTDTSEGGPNLGAVPLSLGLGALAGGALGPLANKLLSRGSKTTEGVGSTYPEFALKETKENFAKQMIKNTGQDDKQLKDAARYLMPTKQALGAGGEEFVQNYAQFMDKTGLKGKKEWEDMWDKLHQDYATSDKVFSDNVSPNWKNELAASVAANPEIAAATGGNKAALARLDEITNAIKNPGNHSISDVRNNLTQIARDNMKSTLPEDNALARAAFAAKGHTDDFMSDTIAPIVGNDFVDSLKYRYKNLQPLLMQQSKEAFRLPKSGGGSPTFEKSQIGTMIGGAAGGGALGSQAKDENGNVNIPAMIGSMAGGAFLGNAANKIIPKLIPIATAGATRAGFHALDNPVISGALVAGANKAITATGENAPRLVGAVAAQSALTKPAKENQDVGSAIDAKEAALPADHAQAAKNEFSAQFKDVMNRKLNDIYTKYYSDMNPKDFLDQVAAHTNNFQDMNGMADVLFQNPKQKEDFLRKYDAYLTLKHIDLDKALKGRGGFLGIGGDEQAANAQELLKEKLMNLQTEGDISKRTPAQQKIMEEQMAMAAKNPALIPSFMKSYGLDFQDLAQMGLVNG